jgi:tripartite ATP-independent transporter DctP family solute receptor
VVKTFKLIAMYLILGWFPCSGLAWFHEIISLGVVTKPGAAQNVCAEKFKELLEGRSGFKIRIYDSGILGTEVEILKKVQENKVHMGIVTSGPFDQFVPEARVIDYPYLFDSYRQVDAIMEGPLGQQVLGALEKAGFKGLSFSENGFRHLTNSRRPVHDLNDVAGLRIRVMESALHKAVWELFGANPVAIGDLNKLVADLQSGTIDGQENPLSAIWLDDFYKGQKYLSLTGHVYSSHISVANLKWFQGLPEQDRKLIRESIEEAARYQKNWSWQNESAFLAKIKASGIIVDEKPDLDSFRKRASLLLQHPIYQGKNVQELLQRFLKAAKIPDNSH